MRELALADVEVARKSHKGVFITGPGRLELLEDTLPANALQGGSFIAESLGNCRCSSDRKAIQQFTSHARIPGNATQVALGHEAIHRIVSAPAGSLVAAGDLVLVTPGQFTSPHDPETYEPDPENGVSASVGYSFRYIGGLRRFNAIPRRAVDVVREQGFGNLFNPVPRHADVSLATLAHAEPYACCHGTMTHMFSIDERGEFIHGIPPRSRVAFLGGTARMAMIKLTILAARPDDELPERVAITGSRQKLDVLREFDLIRRLRDRGVDLLLVDRRSPDALATLQRPGKYNAVFTNFPSQEVFDQAVAIIEDGGNLNNYAGAVDPDIHLTMTIPGVAPFASHHEEARCQIDAMHHNVAPNDPRRVRGIAPDGRVALVGFSGDPGRLEAYLEALGPGSTVLVEGGDHARLATRFAALRFDEGLSSFSDVFVAGSGARAAAAYTRLELTLARNAALNLVDGATTIRIRSKHVHYMSRHQICGPTVPWWMTNTSEPHSTNIAAHGNRPTDFDWLVKGVAGLDHAIEMIEDVNEHEYFGSFFALTQIETFPYVAVASGAFREKAAELEAVGDRSPAVGALESGARVLEKNGETWSRAVEVAIYDAFGIEYPLASA